MKAYFDKINFESFISQRSTDTYKFERCNDMIKRHLDVRLNMSLEEFKSSPLCVSWLTTMTDGAKRFPQPSPNDFNFKPIKDVGSFIDGVSKDEYSAIYLLDDAKVDEVIHNGNFLVGKKGEELEVLYKLIIDEDTNFIASLPPKTHFVGTKDWAPLDNYVRPCSDIIIRDAFLLFNDRLRPYKKNIYSLIQKLSSGIKDTNLNIVIICMKQNTDTSRFEPDWDRIRKEIKDILKKEKNIDAKITYVVANQKKDVGHDRTIFTNYIHYMPNDCLGNFYGVNGDYSSESDQFTINCIATEKNYREAFDFLDRMQGLIYDIMMGNIQGGEVKEDPAGGSLSNYLTFQ